MAPIQADGEKKKLKIVLDKLEKEIDAEHLVKTELKFEKAEGDDEVKINGVVDQLVDFDDNYKVSGYSRQQINIYRVRTRHSNGKIHIIFSKILDLFTKKQCEEKKVNP